MKETGFSDIGRIEAIRLLFEESPFKNERIKTEITDGFAVTSGKMLLEGIDFNLVYFPLKHLGYKSVIAVTGEIYASMATPKSLDIVIGISSKLDFPQIKELWSGMVAAATEHGYQGVRLDLVPSANGLSISISALGEVSSKTISSLPTPKTKDLICISGSLGAAYLGMQALEKGLREFEKNSEQPSLEKNRMLIGAYLKPELEADIPSKLEREGIHPSSGYFITKGLSDAVKRLAKDTGLGAKIYADRIPFEGNSFALGKELNIDPISAAMNGGDDFVRRFVTEHPGIIATINQEGLFYEDFKKQSKGETEYRKNWCKWAQKHISGKVRIIDYCKKPAEIAKVKAYCFAHGWDCYISKHKNLEGD